MTFAYSVKFHPAIIWTNTDPIHWRIYARLGRDELITGVKLIEQVCYPNRIKGIKGIKYIWSRTRARLGRVAPLGRPRSVYKSNIECCFLSQNDGQTLKVKVNDLHFQYQLRESQDAYFGANLVILAQIHYKL